MMFGSRDARLKPAGRMANAEAGGSSRKEAMEARYR